MGILDDITGALPGAVNTGITIAGNQNAAQAITDANLNGINTQKTAMGNIAGYYDPQRNLGNTSMTTLAGLFGSGGKPADFSNFLNMPGYQFAINQGTQAIQRQAAAGGSAYTPQNMANIGQYVTGTAMQDYNTYVNQLMQGAGLGAQANDALTNAQLRTSGNISQEQQNTGMAQAGMYTSDASALTGVGPNGGPLGGGYGPGGGYGYGPGSGVNGVGGLAGGIGGLLGKGIGYIGKMFSGGPGAGGGNQIGGYTTPAGFSQAGGPDGTTYDPYVSDGGSSPYAGAPSPYGNIPMDPSTGSPDWLNGGGGGDYYGTPGP